MARGRAAIRPGSADVTNNEAEYEGLIRGLEAALGEHVRRILVHSDSELVVGHMTGEFECRSARLAPLLKRALRFAARFHAAGIRHVPRARNAAADALAADAATESRSAAARRGRRAASPDDSIAGYDSNSDGSNWNSDGHDSEMDGDDSEGGSHD
jgi:ribonuclease HI